MLRSIVLLIAFLMLGMPAQAQEWPAKPIRLIVNFPPGGAADVLARALGQDLSESLKQQFVVENRPGANGNIGADAVAKSPPDGYTFLMSSGGAVSINPFLYTKMPFDAEKDLLPVASVAVVRVYPGHAPVGAGERREGARRAHEGQSRQAIVRIRGRRAARRTSPERCSSAQRRSRRRMFRTKAQPRRSRTCSAGKCSSCSIPGPGLRYTKEGKLRLLAVASGKRASQYPDTPTFAELGMPSVEADTVFGIYAPAGTSPAIIARLHDEINRVLATPKMAGVINTLGGEIASSTLPAFIDRQSRDRQRFGAFIREAGIKAE